MTAADAEVAAEEREAAEETVEEVTEAAVAENEDQTDDEVAPAKS